MGWVHFEGARDKVYRLRWGIDEFEVRRDATVYRLVNPTETRRYRPDEAGRVVHWTRVRVRGKEVTEVLEEVRRRTSGWFWMQWFYRLRGRWRVRA